MRKKLEATCLTMLCGILASCQTVTPSSETDGPRRATFCSVARAIYYSRKDTPQTIVQVRAHNATGVALKCGWGVNKKV